nr:MAG TPA: hypothetical protein [Caudoviricetes sp.]
MVNPFLLFTFFGGNGITIGQLVHYISLMLQKIA